MSLTVPGVRGNPKRAGVKTCFGKRNVSENRICIHFINGVHRQH